MAGGRLPVVNGKRGVAALMRVGFVVERIVGSHHVLAKSNAASHHSASALHASISRMTE